MRPGGLPTQPGTPGRPRRRPDLTLPMPQRDVPSSLAVPLPLPPPTSSTSGPLAGPTPPAGAPSVAVPPPLAELERVRRVGSGAGGTVWMVRHRATGRAYALKVLYGNHDDAVRRQIAREIAILRRAEHPAVVRCHGMYERGGELQILLEYMDGGSLDGRLIAAEPFLADVARQVLSGIAYLHRHHIVHRDIKPSNLLIDSARRVKIADFGVGRILNQTMDPCNSSVGTIAYMSPERINTDLNDGAYDGYAGDIWSFGLSILEFYLGRFPFGENLGKQGDWAALMCAICYSDPPEPPATASLEFRGFISCCLQKNPAKRLSAARSCCNIRLSPGRSRSPWPPRRRDDHLGWISIQFWTSDCSANPNPASGGWMELRCGNLGNLFLSPNHSGCSVHHQFIIVLVHCCCFNLGSFTPPVLSCFLFSMMV